ncbi:MAG TPA: zinc metalloprotease HtpX [Candidatus Thermoplasmatota archaeon]|nr:zinc metalloprotease HtpX [Candidatus Thermoplasmatota archaeon]
MASTWRTLGLFAALTALFMAVGFVVGAYFANAPLLGSVVFLVIAAAINFVSYFWSDRIVLWSTGAKLVTPEQAPRLHGIVRSLSQKSGLPMPRVAIIPTDQPNAFATGRNPQNAVVAATAGLLKMMDDDAVEAVMAHEMAHVRNRDVLVMSAAATVAGAITFAARAFFWSALFGGSRDGEGGGNIFGMILLAILAPLAAIMVQLAISRSREFMADRGAAEITGRPLELARALRMLETGASRIPMQTGSPSQSHLYIVNPFRAGFVSGLFRTHPHTEERIARLEKLAGMR